MTLLLNFTGRVGELNSHIFLFDYLLWGKCLICKSIGEAKMVLMPPHALFRRRSALSFQSFHTTEFSYGF